MNMSLIKHLTVHIGCVSVRVDMCTYVSVYLFFRPLFSLGFLLPFIKYFISLRCKLKLYSYTRILYTHIKDQDRRLPWSL